MDSILIFPPGPSVAGSQLQIGTYLMYDPGADYGAKGLINSIESSNALRDGAVFAYRNVGRRQMSFPLLLRDVPGQTLLQTESLLRNWTTPGAKVAVQPEQIPSGQAVFFDVIDGRWEPDYDGFEQRAGRRRGTLYLDTQPWGYWPTEILLASSASAGFMGQLSVNGASVIGDIPPLAHVMLVPTVASAYQTGPWLADMVGLSFGGWPSFQPFIPPASFAAISPSTTGNLSVVATLTADPFAPASQAIRHTMASMGGVFTGSVWLNTALGLIPTAIEPAYRGRFRVFAFLKVMPSWNTGIQTLVDTAVGPSSMQVAMASGNQIASSLWGITATPFYSTLDMGEITLPGAASGVSQQSVLRQWIYPASGLPVGSTQVYFGGLYLLPVDGAAGILTRGMAVPSIGGAAALGIGGFNAPPAQGGVEFNAQSVDSVSLITAAPPSAPLPAPIVRNGLSGYRGQPLRLSASTMRLVFLTGDRSYAVATPPVAQANLEYSTVSVSYRPTFQFLYGI